MLLLIYCVCFLSPSTDGGESSQDGLGESTEWVMCVSHILWSFSFIVGPSKFIQCSFVDVTLSIIMQNWFGTFLFTLIIFVVNDWHNFRFFFLSKGSETWREGFYWTCKSPHALTQGLCRETKMERGQRISKGTYAHACTFTWISSYKINTVIYSANSTRQLFSRSHSCTQ